MEDHEQLVIEPENDALPQPADRSHRSPDEDVEFRFNCAEEKGRLDENRLQRLADDPRADRLHVNGDVGQLRHAGKSVP
jgi:hypothetical protein